MTDTAAQRFLKGQFYFYVSVVLCIVLKPEGLTANAGISYYSAHALTAIPYTIGLLSTAWFSFKAAQLLPKRKVHLVRQGLIGICALAVLVAVVPFAVTDTVAVLHIVLSALLFIIELAFIFWVVIKVRHELFDVLLLVLAVVAMLFTLYYLNPIAGYLIAGEVSFQVIFGLSIYRSLKTFEAPAEEKSTRSVPAYSAAR